MLLSSSLPLSWNPILQSVKRSSLFQGQWIQVVTVQTPVFFYRLWFSKWICNDGPFSTGSSYCHLYFIPCISCNATEAERGDYSLAENLEFWARCSKECSGFIGSSFCPRGRMALHKVVQLVPSTLFCDGVVQGMLHWCRRIYIAYICSEGLEFKSEHSFSLLVFAFLWRGLWLKKVDSVTLELLERFSSSFITRSSIPFLACIWDSFC